MPEDRRDPVRRLRGRMPAPVTVWTAWGPGRRAVGLTVSSVMVAEGEPALILGLLGPLTDLYEALESTGRFVVHVLDAGQVRLADQMAGRYPADPFSGQETEASEFGPALVSAPVRAYCRLESRQAAGWFELVSARVDHVAIPDEEASAWPLVHFRAWYGTVAPRARPGGRP